MDGEGWRVKIELNRREGKGREGKGREGKGREDDVDRREKREKGGKEEK